MTMKPDFTDAQIADFLRRSYFVVDGLWFVKTEEKRGFDEAMQLDEAVWEIMSKVQARKAKSLLAIKNGSLRAVSYTHLDVYKRQVQHLVHKSGHRSIFLK